MRPLLLCLIGLLLSGAEPTPFARPATTGIDRLLILDARWTVACIDTLPQVIAEIDRHCAGAYSKAIADWVASAPAGKQPNWGAWKACGELRDRWFQAARDAIGEPRLADGKRWRLAGGGTEVEPAQTRLTFVGVDGGPHGGLHTAYRAYIYQQWPAPMTPGAAYRLALDGTEVATWTWDDRLLVSRAIKVNQVGWRPGDLKLAYIGGWIPGLGALPLEAEHFEVIAADSGAVVHQGVPVLRDDSSRCAVTKENKDPAKRPFITGERLFSCDLSAVTATGSYFVRVPGVGRSWPFRIAEDAYGEAFYVAMRGLFHHRGSFALTRPYTAWTRPRLHTREAYESQLPPFSFGNLVAPKGFERFDVLAATVDRTKVHKDVIGGWYDAADYDRNLSHGTILYDLCWLFEHRPGVFTDGQLNIPESGNGIPDLLDEVEFGLRIWREAQDERGAVPGWFETTTHAAYNDETQPWAFSLRTRWSSLLYATAAAWYARLVEPYSASQHHLYAASARRAYQFGANPTNGLGTVTVAAKRKRGAGEAYTVTWTETPQMWEPFLLLAKQQLFRLTNEATYLDGISGLADRAPKAYGWPYTTKDYSAWFTHALAGPLGDRIPAAQRDRLRAMYTSSSTGLVALTEGMPYRMTWRRDQDYWLSWGATVLYNSNRAIIAGEALVPTASGAAAIVANADAMLGCNPKGYSWTTGLGWCYPAVIQHEWSEKDGIDDPVPGITPYGVTESIYPPLWETLYRPKAPDLAGVKKDWSFADVPNLPVWRRWSPHTHMNVTQCEYTVHETVSASILTFGWLLSPGWMPPASVTGREPRQRTELDGYWHLP